jgi:hypothetical protein
MRLFTVLLVAIAALSACIASAPQTAGNLPIVQGSFEPNFKYPWIVRFDGCGGTLISPRWVLSAAHCAIDISESATFTRTSPSGQMFTDKRHVAPLGVIVHPDYYAHPSEQNDLVLIRLEKPFDVVPEVQIAAVPRDRRTVGVPGFVASGKAHGDAPPPGQISVYHAAIQGEIPNAAHQTPEVFIIQSSSQGGSLCEGDSGSGFITFENGRATLRGVAIEGSVGCLTSAGKLGDFVDVFNNREWILQTMRSTDYLVDGNTRLRRSGELARGQFNIECKNAGYTVKASGPLYVHGIQIGLNCGNDEEQRVLCSVDAGQGALKVLRFSMRTLNEDGSVTNVALPHPPALGFFEGLRPHGTYRDFECKIGRVELEENPPVEPPSEQ